MQITSGDMPMLSDLQLVYMVPRNSTELLKINTTKFQVEREPVYPYSMVYHAHRVHTYSLSARILHRAPPPRLQVDQNFLTQKIVADPKIRCHQKSFGIWRVTEAILGQKTCFFSKNIFWKKFIINHTIFLIFRYAFYRY